MWTGKTFWRMQQSRTWTIRRRANSAVLLDLPDAMQTVRTDSAGEILLTIVKNVHLIPTARISYLCQCFPSYFIFSHPIFNYSLFIYITIKSKLLLLLPPPSHLWSDEGGLFEEVRAANGATWSLLQSWRRGLLLHSLRRRMHWNFRSTLSCMSQTYTTSSKSIYNKVCTILTTMSFSGKTRHQ